MTGGYGVIVNEDFLPVPECNAKPVDRLPAGQVLVARDP